MGKVKALRHISRIDQEKRNQHGWWVRIHRQGEMIHRFFSDKSHGGKGRALDEAKRHRDALLLLYPKPEHGNMFNRVSSRNTSGRAGIHRTISRKRGRVYEVWQAGWVLPDGRHVNRKFHFSPGGTSETEAKRKAIRARAEGLAQIEKMRRAKKKTTKRATVKQAIKKRLPRKATKRLR
jgi:hypothetical protein